MRIDKYLWCVRLFKTRSLAASEVKNDRVMMDDEAVKPSREIKEGDSFTVKYHGYSRSFTVLGIPKARVGAKLVPNLLEETTSAEEIEKKSFSASQKTFNGTKELGDLQNGNAGI